jgi:ATP-binding cassette, subfamily B, bacterial
VLLLDEATSHLDVLTEQEVDRNLSALSCTRIVIAHRLSTVENADLILVFQSGAIVERGKHAELLALGGHYAQLVANQLEEEAA